jgi:predicted GTPase
MTLMTTKAREKASKRLDSAEPTGLVSISQRSVMQSSFCVLLLAVCFSQCLRLGCGEPLFISAKSSDGLLPLYDILHEHAEAIRSASHVSASAHLTDHPAAAAIADMERQGGDVVTAALATPGPTPSLHATGLPVDTTANPDDARFPRPIRVAIVGRPNVGKSSLLNQIVGFQRVLVGPTPGVTRDATEVDVVTPDGVALRLVDTCVRAELGLAGACPAVRRAASFVSAP